MAVVDDRGAELESPAGPHMAELIAIYHGAKHAVELGLNSFCVQSDCAGAVALIQSTTRQPTEAGAVVDAIRSLRATNISFDVIFLPRNCNTVAHVLAKKALLLEENSIWKENVPSECFDLLLADMP